MSMSVAENLAALNARIAKAAAIGGRDAGNVQLVAVSKQQPEARVRAALDAGHRLFGENRVQEAQKRWAALRTEYPELRLHLIGPLQTNKVKDAVALFDVIETLDREKLALALAEEMKKQNRHLPCFIQINTGAEDQKSGIAPDQLPSFLEYARKTCGLNVIGLMCIPPLEDPPALHFALLKKLADEQGLAHLSMGMSEDFEKAVKLGATSVRIGTGVFGARDI